MSASPQQIEARKTWLKALASDSYQQLRGGLARPISPHYREDTRRNAYCTLGVACHALGVEAHESNGVISFGKEGATRVMPAEARDQMGLVANPMVNFGEGVCSVSALNDTHQLGFDKVRELLEPLLLDPSYDGTRVSLEAITAHVALDVLKQQASVAAC